MMKREMPKVVTQLNGRTFVARYRHVTRAHLPRCPYRQKAAPRDRHHR